MTNKFAKTQALYDQFAPQFTQHFEKKLDTTELDKFLALMPPEAFILDAGCGSARDAAYFIEKGHDAMGIDLSERLLEEARKKHPEVLTEVMSLTEMTFPENNFDGIWCKAAILHLERQDVPKVLGDFFKILKPGGALYLQTKQGEGEGDQPVPFNFTIERHFTFFQLDELRQALIDAGFEILDAYEFNGQQRSKYSRDQGWVSIFAKKPGVSAPA